MDNKITKKRLSDFLSYEWIFMIVMAVVAILGWELIYHVSSVQLTTGQSFKFYYDQSVVPISTNELVEGLLEKNTFSYDVIKLKSETLDPENNVLSSRLSIQDGDIIFTDAKGRGKNEEGKDYPMAVRAKSLVDSGSYPMYALDDMLEDAKTYLRKNFITDGQEIEIGNIDEVKLEKTFRKRMKDDNRFRKESQIKEGIKKERARIEKLINDVLFFEYFINQPEYQSALFRYTKYEQAYNRSLDQDSKKVYKEWMERESEKIYAIDIGALNEIGNGVDATKLVQVRSPENEDDDLSKNVVLMVFNFKKYQPHLQYESLSFVCSTIQMLLGETV